MIAAPPDRLASDEVLEPVRPVSTRASRRRALILAARALRSRLRLPPKLTLSEWADEHRMLSAESSAQPGPWRTDRAPYLREIMDTISGREYQDITIVKCSQSGGSEAGVLNPCGFFMDQEPSAILVIQPNVKPMAEAFSKSRLAPMIRDCVRLRGKVKDPRSRDSGNTILQKSFPGGTLFIMGANSPAGLASNPIRVVLADELDRWPASAGTEGDPLSLADARQITYRHRRKTVKISSPGNEGESRIEKEWPLTDQRHFYVPCPHCGHEQPLEWRDTAGAPDIRPGKGDYRISWEKETSPETGETIVHHPETAVYVCRECGAAIDETHKPAMLAAGHWVKHNPSSRRAGFHIPGEINPWVRWTELAEKWLRAKDDDELRKTFINTMLGLLYVPSGATVDFALLSSRRETYAAEVPMGVGLLTMAIDVQGDRIECEVRGWGAKEECWQIRLERFYGDPESPELWQNAATMIDKAWTHESGATLRIRRCMIDSGYAQDAVFAFVKSRPGGVVYATKGVDNAKQPLSKPTKANRDGVRVFNFNPTAFKDVLFARLKKTVAGAGYLHFGTAQQTGAPEDYFPQFGNETRRVTWRGNRPRVEYINPGKRRNEAIDLYVGNLVALRSLGMTISERLGLIAAEVRSEGDAIRAAGEAEASTPAQDNGDGDTTPNVDAPPPRRRSSWMRQVRGY